MSEIRNLKTLCRCCHADGEFKSLQDPYIHHGATEIYAELLSDTFGLHIHNPSTVEASHAICERCIVQLRLAHRFKEQVLACERIFEEYCKIQETIVTSDAEFSIDNHVIIISYDDDDLENEYEAEIEDEKADEVAFKSETKATVPPPVDDNDDVNADDVKAHEIENKKWHKDHVYDDAHEIENKKWHKDHVYDDAHEIENKKWHKDHVYDDGNFTIKRELKREISSHALNYLSNVKKPNKAIQNVPILYKCEFCVETFRLKRQVDEHQRRSHTGDKPYLCETCSKGFASQDSLKEHVILEHSQIKDNIYICDYCKKIFSRRLNLTEHMKRHTGISKVFVCETCGREFNVLRSLIRHVEAVHEKLRPYKCDLCVKSFALKRNLEMHHKSFHSEGTRFQCEFCNIGFNRIGRLREHLVNEHNQRYECEHCNKAFKWNRHLREHIRSHMGQSTVFICEACGRSFDRERKLKWHVSSVHENLRPFKCDVCDKTFKLKNSLVVHNRTFHTGERSFKCKVCSQSFATEEYLKIHCKRKHFNRDSFYCDYCHKVFKDKRSFKCHINWHKGEGFPCEICGHLFTEQGLLKRHVMAVHQKLKPHKCDLCDKAFSRKNNLDAHKKSHTGEESFPIYVSSKRSPQ